MGRRSHIFHLQERAGFSSAPDALHIHERRGAAVYLCVGVYNQ